MIRAVLNIVAMRKINMKGAPQQKSFVSHIEIDKVQQDLEKNSLTERLDSTASGRVKNK